MEDKKSNPSDQDAKLNEANASEAMQPADVKDLSDKEKSKETENRESVFHYLDFNRKNGSECEDQYFQKFDFPGQFHGTSYLFKQWDSSMEYHKYLYAGEIYFEN